uniref:Integrase catalytic domain-containing protein n=1 Tax=Phytophthora ramorum TaxID=164328 RepID=H3GFB6_PHYRM
MTERAREISAFFTPFGLFEWTRMPFRLKNAPQIYQRLIDNALYGYLQISPDRDHAEPTDVFEKGEPEAIPGPSVLGRRSYIDDILITADTWDSICQNVEALLDACERWNLSISVVKSFWGHRKVEARTAFDLLKDKLAATPILRHFDPDRQPVIVVYANKWAISAALVQEHDGMYWPVIFTSRTLKANELNYGIVDKEVLALLRILDVWYTRLTNRSIKVLSRYSTLAWLLNSSGFQGRLGRWAALLSEWTLEIRKCLKGEDEILDAIAASIIPRAEVDEALIAIELVKELKRTIVMAPSTVELDEELLVVSFDGSAHVKRSAGVYSAIVWKLLEWSITSAVSEFADDLPVNEAEYRGLLLGFKLLSDQNRGRVVICGDSNLIIRQMRGEIDCKAPGLQILHQKAMDQVKAWPKHEFLHVKCDWNQSADWLASAALQREAGVIVTDEGEIGDLITINRLGELLQPSNDDHVVQISAVTRSARRHRQVPATTKEETVQRMRSERLVQAQDDEKWIVDLKLYLRGDVAALTARDAKVCAKIASDYEVGEDGLLFYCVDTARLDKDRDSIARLVVPATLHQDFLHHYHASLEGGHQGIGRTYQRIKAHFHWRGLFKSVQQFMGECVDCETEKGRPVVQGESPGNVRSTYPFQTIAMDHIPSLPKQFKGNTELLVWVDLFSGYVIAKAGASRTAQTIAENYEDCVFRRFGASEAIRHDREPGFMSDFFRAFSRIVGQRQRATMVYRPQANGTTERMVQTLTRALKMYVADVNQQDWDEYAERLTFAINTAHDRVRGETPFYLIHGWDPRSTLEASLPLGSTRRRDREPRRWRYRIQQQYQRAREEVNARLMEAIQARADRHNDGIRPHQIEAGSQVWLYLDRVKEGYARKLAHMWHGPFRVREMIGPYAARLEVAGTEYRLFPIVHVSKLKAVKVFSDRPDVTLATDESGRFDFDEALLPEDSWEGDWSDDEFEVDRIADVRSGRKTRYGRVHREFQVF